MASQKEQAPPLSELVQMYNDILTSGISPEARKSTNTEFEVRFDQKLLNLPVFERTFDELISRGFTVNSAGYSLRTSVEYETLDEDKYTSKIRVELDDLNSIQKLCSSNILPEESKFVMKQYAFNKKKQKCMFDNRDYKFRVSIQNETTKERKSLNVKEIIDKWGSSLKTFRYIYRTSLIHPDYPNIRVDLSKVRMNNTKTVNFIDSNILEAPEGYEIEIEYTGIQRGFNDAKKDELIEQMKNVIKFVLSSIQGSPYPVKYQDINSTLIQYLTLVGFKRDKKDNRFRKDAKQFIGPSSFTLQPINLVNSNKLENICIQRDNYCVTDKADGTRKMLFVNKQLKLFFIDSNLNFHFTGLYLPSGSKYANTIIDGEYIDKDKYGRVISRFAAFDLYFLRGNDVRGLVFKNAEATNDKQRHSLLLKTISEMSNELVGVSETGQLRISIKEFYFSEPNNEQSLFAANAKCFDAIREKEYDTDGFIFTPMNLGVTQETPDDPIRNNKYTWAHSFKWKPPEFNTIDFLISVEKDGSRTMKQKQKLQNGEIINYYTVNLKVGVNKHSHGLIGSQQRILSEEVKLENLGTETGRSYSPELFYPTGPSDSTAHICHVKLQQSENGMKMFTEENDIMDDDTIVEFRYDLNAVDKLESWIPIRVRHDKTSEYRNKKNNFGNAYHVANSNWQSIHNPVTQEMLTGTVQMNRDNLLDINNDIYYNRSKNDRRAESQTFNLRRFHNELKESLIKYAASKQENTKLLDLAVGKAGDLHKWLKSGVKYVLGIDVAEDNIHNPHDGACKRYIDLFTNKKIRKQNAMFAMFVTGDTSKNIESGRFDKDKDKKSAYIVDALLGSDNIEPETVKEPYLSKNYGIFRDKFDICSIQFALHYMFENEEKLHAFAKNVSDMTHVGSYFIGTCYDGKKVFEMLKEKGGDVELYKNNRKIWGITKQYVDSDDFMTNTPQSLGFKISVFQESINQNIEEYLVNFDYFEKLMEDYGFKKDPQFMLNQNKMKGIDNFKTIYDAEQSNRKRKSSLMSEEEKTISFLNKYFVFKKVRDIVVDPSPYEETTEPTNIGKAEKENRTIILEQL